jgi:hypothetical protein
VLCRNIKPEKDLPLAIKIGIEEEAGGKTRGQGDKELSKLREVRKCKSKFFPIFPILLTFSSSRYPIPNP